MADKEQGSSFSFFIIGAVIGAVAGVLLAPRPGDETREQIGDWLKEKREESADLVADLRDKIPAQKDRVVAAIKAGKQAFQENSRKEEKEELVNS